MENQPGAKGREISVTVSPVRTWSGRASPRAYRDVPEFARFSGSHRSRGEENAPGVPDLDQGGEFGRAVDRDGKGNRGEDDLRRLHRVLGMCGGRDGEEEKSSEQVHRAPAPANQAAGRSGGGREGSAGRDIGGRGRLAGG